MDLLILQSMVETTDPLTVKATRALVCVSV